MLNFDFLEKSLGIVSLSHFVYDFSKKMFLALCFINWSNFIACLSLLWDIGQYVYCNCLLTSCNVINSEINLIFLIKPFFDMTKNPKIENKNILRTGDTFKVK